MGCLGALLLLLGGLGALAWTCEIAKVDSDLVERLGQRLLPWMDRLSPEQLNPSIYVGLRLSGLQAGPKEAHYLHSLKLSYQQSLLRSVSSNDKSDSEAKPSMGQLALYLLALRANCEFVGSRKGDRLVSQLKRFLETEKRAIGHNHKGHPHTSYYQYGLSILALCLHRKRVHDSVVGKLLYAIEHEQHPDLSVDTTAMAGLAFSCLEVSNLNLNQRDRIALAIQRVQERILRAQTPEGHFGNVYSTPLALQVRKSLGLCAPHPHPGLVGGDWSGAGRPGSSWLASHLLPLFSILSPVPDDLPQAHGGAGHSMPQGKGCSVGQPTAQGLPESSRDFSASACPEPEELRGSHLAKLPGTKSHIGNS
uniref:Transcobalamin-2 n=1 Tax=Sus scrofa TaxID=9823 RepID=A0A8D0YMH2_PIG